MYEPRSTQLNELVVALAKARTEMKPPKKSKYHAQFKYDYSTYEDMAAAATPALKANGLTVIMAEDYLDGHMFLVYSLEHVSGQYTGGRSIIKNISSDAEYRKSLGWAITNAYNLLVGCADLVGEEKEFITKDQEAELREFIKASKEAQAMIPTLLKAKGITKLSELFKGEFDEILAEVKKLVK